MSNRIINLFFGLGLAIIVCWLLRVMQFFFLPLAIAVLISFLLNPLVNRLTRRKVPLIVAASTTIVLTVLFVWLVGSIVLGSLLSFQDQFPKYESKINAMISEARNLTHIDIGPLDNLRLRTELSRLSLSSMVASTLNSFFNLIWYLLFIFVFLIYLVFGRPKLPLKINQAFPERQAARINEALEAISHQVQSYIGAKTLTSFITGALVVIVCLFFTVDFPITWGFFTFLLNFIPTIGVLLAALMPAAIALVQHGWVTALWLLVVLTAIMLVLGNMIEPKILGDSVNLSPLVALFALIFWGWLWGAAGMIVAVPLTASIKFTCDNIEELRPIGALMGGKV
ncbi:MAG: AI-2E family transporter [Proteobacteria bacterium]|nr:AI-2E family transporter [Pseudomonadota bacterium]